MSKRQFVSTLIPLIIINLIIKATFIFGIDMQVQNRVGASTYGIYFTLLNLCYIFQILNDFGLNLLHNTDTATQGKVRVESWQQILRLKVVLSLLYSLVVFSAAYILGYGYVWKLLIILVANNILISLISVLRAGISGTGRYKSEALISVMDKVLMIIICSVLLLGFPSFHIEWFAWAQLISLAITAVAAFVITNRFIDRTQSSINREPMEIIFKNTLPFVLATFLMFIYSRSDSIMIEQLLPDGARHVGGYAAGFRLLDAANMIAFLFTPLLIPMYARLHDNRHETIQLIRLALGMMIFIVGCISIMGFWWGWPIMQLCYGNVDPQWVLNFRLLILSHVPIGLMYIFGSYLTATGQLRQQNILYVFSVLFNIGLNFFMIPHYGIVGAAITTLITQGLTTTGLIILGHMSLKEKPDLNQMFNILIFFTILGASGWILESSSLPWPVEIVLFLLVTVLSAFLFKLIRGENFKQLLVRKG